MKENSIYLLYALGGVIVGAAVAMLTAPQSGRELRGKIRSVVDETMAEMWHHHGHHCNCEHPATATATEEKK
jgi:gas vesicle protein